MSSRSLMLLVLAALACGLRAADFDADPDESSFSKPAKAEAVSEHSVGDTPPLLRAGQAPSAYMLPKYGVHTDLVFYGGGGILTRVDLGIFSRFFLGGALNLPAVIGSGAIPLHKEDAQLLARLLLLQEDARIPAISLGWDGPAWGSKELRGLYVVASKQFATPFGLAHLHAGINSPAFDTFQAPRDLRGFLAATASFRQALFFFEADELNSPLGGTLSTGARVFFDPISVGLEFRDLNGSRNSAQVSRVLTVSFDGVF